MTVVASHSCKQARKTAVTITRVGASKKYAQNWAQAFGGKKSKSAGTESTKKQEKKKSGAAKSPKAKGSAKR